MLGKAKHLASLSLIFLFAMSALALAAVAQKSNNKGGNITVTGCLQKGDEADEFSLTADDGKLYDLRSTTVKLADHVGHKVTVTGKFKPEANEKEEAKESKESGKKEAGDIRVSNLKMVSSSCQ